MARNQQIGYCGKKKCGKVDKKVDNFGFQLFQRFHIQSYPVINNQKSLDTMRKKSK